MKHMLQKIHHPLILEINAWPWLNELSLKLNYQVTFQNLPEDILQESTQKFDIIWFMGVWSRSPKSKKIAQNHLELQIEYKKALPDYTHEDVIGSPYSIQNYIVDPHLGGNVGLKRIYDLLHEWGKKVILDFVPNHVALDHPWVDNNPDYFITGINSDLEHNPEEFIQIKNRIYAYGRDPYFFPWTDTIQLNSFSDSYRTAAIKTILNIGDLADGVRCDMAMLLTTKIFQQTWGNRAGLPPKHEFWHDIIKSVRIIYPNFLFIAEVYWDMEWDLQQQGFNFCYDKRLFDRLVHQPINQIRDHLKADLEYQSKLVRFIENHDEPRAITTFGYEKSLAAATITMFLPGAHLFQNGQIEGKRIKLPVQLGRFPKEKPQKNIEQYYVHLLTWVMKPEIMNGKWTLLERIPLPFLAQSWQNTELTFIIITNYSPNTLELKKNIQVLEIPENTIEFQLINMHPNDRIKEKGTKVTKEEFFDLIPEKIFAWHTIAILLRLNQ